MGFELFGRRIFDLSTQFSYCEVFVTMFVVGIVSLLIFFSLSKEAKKRSK